MMSCSLEISDLLGMKVICCISIVWWFGIRIGGGEDLQWRRKNRGRRRGCLHFHQDVTGGLGGEVGGLAEEEKVQGKEEELSPFP